MVTKTLEDELRKKNDGLVSVEFGEPLTTDISEGDIVEAPSGDLPDTVEELSSEGEDKMHEEISYLCRLAGKDSGYIGKMEERLESLLDRHNFLKKEHYHKRLRDDEGFVDYLFLKEFAGKPGTYGVTLDIDESEKFESLLSKYQSVVKNRKVDNYGAIGAALGFIPAIGVGVSAGIYSASALEELSILISIWTSVAVIISSVFTGSWLGRRHLRDASKKLYDALQEYEQEGKVKSSPDKYNIGIINHYLNLTPKWLLEKK